MVDDLLWISPVNPQAIIWVVLFQTALLNIVEHMMVLFFTFHAL
jgi:hypothetical protein